MEHVFPKPGGGLNSKKPFLRFVDALRRKPLFVTVFILLSVIIGVLLWQVNQLAALNRWVDDSDELIVQSQLVERQIIDLETGLRGFLIAGDPIFLEPFRQAQLELPATIATLRELSQNNPEQEKRIHEIESILNEWQAYAKNLIHLKKVGGDTSSSKRTREGKRLIDAIRETLNGVFSTEEQLKKSRISSVRSASKINYWTIFMSFAGLALLLLRYMILRVHGKQAAYVSEEYYRNLLHSIKDYAIFSLDLNGKITSWSEGARLIKGYSASEVIGKHFSIFYMREDIDSGKPARELKEALSMGRVEDIGWRLRKNGSRFWANIIISLIKDDAGKPIGFSKVTRDLTERKTVAELEDIIEARDEFLSIASHELKTPITSFHLQQQLLLRIAKKVQRLYSEGLKSGIPLPSELLEQMISNIERSKESSNRVVSLLNDLLDVSRIRLGHLTIDKQETNLIVLIQNVIRSFSAEIKNAHVTLTFHPLVPVIKGYWDPQRIEQVIVNLVSNALKYGEKKPIEVGVTEDRLNQKAILYVKDHGPGISSDLCPRIFQRFERGITSKKISGLGLGLYIVKQIVQAHGGTIYVESKLGIGSTFTMELPLSMEIKYDQKM